MIISVVDYGLGNPGSVINMLKRLGHPCELVTTQKQISQSQKLILPGVGSFDAAMDKLDQRELTDALLNFGQSKKPFLGICLGMQLLFDSSDEGVRPGLGLLPGKSVKFEVESGVRVPHMGWNRVEPSRHDPLFEELPTQNRFYFVHSYHVLPTNKEHILATTEYGQHFVSMVRSGNIIGAQFHPEKSHIFGLTLLRNFATMTE